jgi:glutaredoxin
MFTEIPQDRFMLRHVDRISKFDAVVYSISHCPYCKRAKQALARNGYSFDSLEVDQSIWDKNFVKYRLSAMSGTSVQTFPQIFLKGQLYDCEGLLAKFY